MIVYQTDKDGFFVGAINADISPLETDVYDEFGVLLKPAEYLIPAGAVKVAPPVVGANQAAKFAAGAWALVADFRGTKYWTADHKEFEIKERGVTVPVGTFPADPALTATEIDARKDARANAEAASLVARAMIDEIYPHLAATKPTKAALLIAIRDNVKARL